MVGSGKSQLILVKELRQWLRGIRRRSRLSGWYRIGAELGRGLVFVSVGFSEIHVAHSHKSAKNFVLAVTR